MTTRLSMIATTLAALIASSTFAAAHTVDASTAMTIDDSAPLRATLLPTVTIDATQATSESNPPRMHVAEAAPIEVTLLPTVHVTARVRPALAATLLPTGRVTAVAPPAAMFAEEVDTAPTLPVLEDSAQPTSGPASGLSARAMPR